MPAVDNELEWIIERSNDDGSTWEYSFLNMSRPPECKLPHHIFYYLVEFIGEKRHLLDSSDLSAHYRVFRPQSQTEYCLYTVKYLLECSKMFDVLSENEPFEILT